MSHVIQTIGFVEKLKGLQTVDSSSVKEKGHGSIEVLKAKMHLTPFKLWAHVCTITNSSKGVTTTFCVKYKSNNEK